MQPALFYESFYDAMREVVRVLGGSKEVGHLLRPELPPDTAGRWVSDCLNPDRREKFDPEQVLLLLRKAREANCHAAMHFICSDAGYSAPQPVAPQDAFAQLQREFIETSKALSALGSRIERAISESRT